MRDMPGPVAVSGEGTDSMRLDIATDDVPERQRFDAWNHAIFSTLAISVQPLPDATGPFRARFLARTKGPLLNCSFDADGFRATRQNREIAHRQWDCYWIVQESSAGASHRIAGQDVVSNTGDLLIGDTDVTSDTLPADRYDHALWVLPKAMIAPHLPVLGRPLLARLSGHNGVDGLAASYLGALARNWDNIPEPAMRPITDTLARLIGIACGAVAAAQPEAVRAGRLVEAKCYIDRHLADPDLSPASAASALRISARSLHALFEPAGTSFARHVLRRRLEECRAALLGNPPRPVIDIAFAWGFSSLSGFYRAFQAAFGMSPGDLRAAQPAKDRF
jgi:AraC family transcriptional regulator, positive regulator of tynA and feaB